MSNRENEILALVKQRRNSSFNRDKYNVNVDIKDFVKNMLMFTHAEIDRVAK